MGRRKKMIRSDQSEAPCLRKSRRCNRMKATSSTGREYGRKKGQALSAVQDKSVVCCFFSIFFGKLKLFSKEAEGKFCLNRAPHRRRAQRKNTAYEKGAYKKFFFHMDEVDEAVIELGADGAFDLSDVGEAVEAEKTNSTHLRGKRQGELDRLKISEEEPWEKEKNLGNDAFAANDYDKAMMLYTKALEKCSTVAGKAAAARGLDRAKVRCAGFRRKRHKLYRLDQV